MTDEELKILEIAGKQVDIDILKDELKEYDYIGVKIAMGVATREEYADKIAYTEELRSRIRELEGEE